MTLQEIESELLKLNPSSRAKIAGKLLESLETLTEEEREQLWAEEALRRHYELASGKSVSVPVEEVLQMVRKQIG